MKVCRRHWFICAPCRELTLYGLVDCFEGEEAYGLTTSDGTLIVGSDRAAAAQVGDVWTGSIDDTVVFNATTEYYRTLPSNLFQGWGAEGMGEGLTRSWTGIQGYTHDTLPFVGAVPNMTGLYIAAGFHGHGMARCLIAARGVVHSIQSKSGAEWDERLPQEFRITSERMQATFTSTA